MANFFARFSTTKCFHFFMWCLMKRSRHQKMTSLRLMFITISRHLSSDRSEGPRRIVRRSSSGSSSQHRRSSVPSSATAVARPRHWRKYPAGIGTRASSSSAAKYRCAAASAAGPSPQLEAERSTLSSAYTCTTPSALGRGTGCGLGGKKPNAVLKSAASPASTVMSHLHTTETMSQSSAAVSSPDSVSVSTLPSPTLREKSILRWLRV